MTTIKNKDRDKINIIIQIKSNNEIDRIFKL